MIRVVHGFVPTSAWLFRSRQPLSIQQISHDT
jgi:hypothetical protein